MILDYNYMFDGSPSATTGVVSGVSVGTTGGSTISSTNVLDLLNARDMDPGEPKLKIMVLCTTAFTSTGAATIQVLAQGSTDNVTYTTYAETPAIIATSIAVGTKFAQFDFPGVNPDSGSLPRYLRLRYSTGVSTISAGQVISALVLGRDMSPNRNYPPGTTVVN